METLGFLGYGRFGAALGGLLREAGHAVRAFDPHHAPPDELAVGDLDALVAGASVLVVATPVPAMRAAFDAITTRVEPGQIVIDVGSVKSLPAEGMNAVFGTRVPWVATHPLFGPASLARGERPREVVVCPNPLHPDAVARIEQLYRSVDCEVLTQDAAAHDRAMAWTQALAFFVAKGMLDAGAPAEAPHAPPSFQGLARTVAAVRSDAGHLFAAMHRDNPYAGEMRTRLLEALAKLDREIGDETALRADEASDPAFVIPDLGARSPALREARELIDEVDREIVVLLARRAELARRAARAKAALGHGIFDPQREASLFAERRAWATAHELLPDGVDEVFRSIVRLSRRLQG